MKNKNKNGIKWITCDNLGEMVEEFKKFRNSQSEADRQQRGFDNYFFLSGIRQKVIKVEGGVVPSGVINSVGVYQENGVDLSLKLKPLNLNAEQGWEPYIQKVKNILKEIWETGEVKNYQGLDLDWPAVSHPNQNRFPVWCDQCHKCIGEGKLAWFSDVKKNLDFCSESCHSKFKGRNFLEEENKKLKEQLEKETNHKIIWMVIAIVAISIFVLTLLFGWLKIKKLKKR